MAKQFVVPSIFTAVDKFSAPVKAMATNVNKFAAKAQVGIAKAEMGFRKLTSPIRAIGRQLGQFGLILGTAGIISVVGGAINTFKDFEQANANLSAVLGKSKSETVDLANDAKRLGAVTAFTASQVVELQTEYAKLGFSQSEILGVTEATLSLAAATNTELGQAAAQVGAAIRAFGLDASEATRVADAFAASTSKSALDMEKLNVSMSTVAPVAKQFGFSIEDTLALLGKLSDAGFDASTAATSTRNILLNLADGNGKLAKALGGPVKTLPELVAGMQKLREKGVDLNKMLNLTDKRSVAAFATFLDGAGSINELSIALQNSEGAAKKMADTQLDTLGGSVTILKSAYEGFILSLEDGTGKFSNTLKSIVQVATEMLSMASGTAKARSELTETEGKIRLFAERSIMALKIIGLLTASVIAFKIAIIASKATLAGYNAVMWVWRTAQAVNLALQGKTLLFLKGNRAAMIAYRLVVFSMTVAKWAYIAVLGVFSTTSASAQAAQWGLNAAMAANPIGLIILAIAALIAIIAVIIVKYDEWGAALTFALGPLGMIINLIMSFKRNWDAIEQAFANGGILGGLKAIGKVILDSLLMPLQQVLELIGKIPGIGGFAQEQADKVAAFRGSLGLETNNPDQPQPETVPAVNTKLVQQENFNQTLEKNTNKTTTVDFKNVPAGTTISGDTESLGNVIPKLGSTLGW